MSNNAPIVGVPITSDSVHDDFPVILNPQNEPAVDVILGTNTDVDLVAWLRPGRVVGEELIVRNIRRTKFIDGGIDQSNKASLTLHVMVPDSLELDPDYFGFGQVDAYTIPSFATHLAFFGPAIVIFRWSGASWLPILEHVPTA